MTPEQFYVNLGTPFGYQYNYPTPGAWGTHTGADYPWAQGTPVPSPGAGTVTGSGYNSTHGYYVSVHYPSVNLYMHFCHLVGPGLSTGSVTKGTTLGQVGNTGLSYGAHLHAAASTSSTPGSTGTQDPVPVINALLQSTSTSNQEEEDLMYYQATGSSSDGLIANGYIYVNDAFGPLRALSSLEGSARMAAGGFIAQWAGADIRTLVKIVGLRQQGSAQGLTFSSTGASIINDGRLTGTIVY